MAANSANHGTGLYRIDPQSGAPQLVFSTRRRPVEHPLDSHALTEPFTLFAGADGQPVIGLWGEEWFFRRISDGTLWQDPVRTSVQAATSTPSGTLLLRTLHMPKDFNRLQSVAFVSPQGRPELLLRDDSQERLPAGEPVWNLPAALSVPLAAGERNYCAALLGDVFYLLAWETGGSPWGASKADLYVFQRGRRDATALPLRFQVSPEDEPQLPKTSEANLFRFPAPDHNGLIATDRGLAIAGRGMPGFWFIPQADLQHALATREEPARQSANEPPPRSPVSSK
jgi:hypothetical protein